MRRRVADGGRKGYNYYYIHRFIREEEKKGHRGSRRIGERTVALRKA